MQVQGVLLSCLKILSVNKSIKMRKLKGIFASAIMGSVLLSTSCSSPTEKVDQAKVKVGDAEKDLKYAQEAQKKEVEEYDKLMSEKLAEQEKIIADFNERIKVQKKEAKTAYELKLEELNNKHTDMKKKMAEFKAGSQTNWASFKIAYNAEMEDLGYAFDELKAKMGTDDAPKK
jgi:hypothetical protein